MMRLCMNSEAEESLIPWHICVWFCLTFNPNLTFLFAPRKSLHTFHELFYFRQLSNARPPTQIHFSTLLLRFTVNFFAVLVCFRNCCSMTKCFQQKPFQLHCFF